MIKKLYYALLTGLLCYLPVPLFAQSNISFDKYHNPVEVQEMMKQLQQSNPARTQIHTIAASPGGTPVSVLEIGKNLQDVPAVFVGANFEGNIPISTEGALGLAKMLLDSSRYTKNLKWYIMPLPNPDAAKGYFNTLKYNRTVNNFEINNDNDEALNEDGYDDLNGDGLITQMRVKDMQGTHIFSKSEPQIMVRADATKSERGEYKIYDEGIDNDGDGKYNEDGEGGINIGISFPHLFPYNKKEAGQWSGQTPEVYGTMRFIFDHPNIAMVYTLGSSDFCLVPPKGGRKGGANLQNLKIPARYARMMNADPNKTYPMEEVIEKVKELVPPGTEVTPSMVAGILGLGAAVNPLDEDLKFYTLFSEDYKKYLKAKNFNTERLSPAPAKDGSFELWAYYHLGVPSFSMNLFTVPKVKEEKKKEAGELTMEKAGEMSPEEFVALGENKIDSFLKAGNAPDRFSGQGVIEMMQSGKLTPKQMVEMLNKTDASEKKDVPDEKDKALLAWSEKEWQGKGFVPWEKVNHPDFEEAEVGGYIPYLENTPKPEKIDSLLNIQLPWLLKLTEKMPSVSIASEKITDLGGGVYRLELFIENSGYLPYPIAMGQRNNQPSPVIVLLEGDVKLLEGLQRTPLGNIGGNQVKKLTWLLQSNKKTVISTKIESEVFGSDVKQIKIGG
jgi:hypothetical protein